MALSAGQQHNRILVLEPTTSAWMYYEVGGENNEIDQIDIDFSSLLKKLEEEQVEYDLGCESIISDYGDIKNGKFEIGDQQYSFVVIPASMDNVNEKTADLLEEFMTFGGIVLSLGPPPVYIDGVETERCSEWPNKFQEEWIAINRINDPRFINFLLSDEFILVEQEGGNLFHQRRIMNDGQLLFLVNSSKTEACKTRFVLQGNDIVKMDPFSGEIENFSCVITSDILSFDATIPPVGSLLLYICDGEIKSRKTRSRKWRGKEKQVEISSIETSALSENVINLDYCYITSNGDTSQLIYSGLDTLNFSSGFEATFPFYLGTNTGDMNMKLAVKNPDLYEVSLNGITAELAEGERWLDKNIGLHDIGKNLHSGENMVTLKAIPGKANFNIEPVYLIGDFEVFALDKAWIIGKSSLIEIGSWKNQGYPFYSDKMKYSASVNNDGRGMAKVILPDWMGTIAYVEVNGSRVGQIFSSPGELRIEKYLKRGENSISVTVVGSLKNLLGPHHYVNQRGTLTPIRFRDAPATQPSGMKYDLVNYGLMEPFQVIVSD